MFKPIRTNTVLYAHAGISRTVSSTVSTIGSRQIYIATLLSGYLLHNTILDDIKEQLKYLAYPHKEYMFLLVNASNSF